MDIGKLGDIKDFGIYDNPLLILLVVDRTVCNMIHLQRRLLCYAAIILRLNMTGKSNNSKKYLWNLF